MILLSIRQLAGIGSDVKILEADQFPTFQPVEIIVPFFGKQIE